MITNANTEVACLIYMSSAIDRISEQNLDLMITENREIYAQKSITGLLLYHDENYLGIIEGDKIVIEDFYRNEISLKKHHVNVHVLFRGKSPTRNFDEWSMGFRRYKEDPFHSGLPGYINMSSSDLGFSIFERFACADRMIFKSIKGFCQCTGLLHTEGANHETLKPI